MDNSFVSKAKLPVAVSAVNKFPLKSQWLGTNNFLEFCPAYARELRGDSHGVLHHSTFVRCLPLDRPCLGSAQIHNRAFFVPFRTVWEPITDMLNNVPHNTPDGTQLITQTPILTWTALSALFRQSDYSEVVGSAIVFDFKIGSGTDTVYYRYTRKGRLAKKFLESLGYKVVFPEKTDDLEQPSLLPLLCAVKVFIDWYYPQAYAHYGNYATIDGIFQRHYTYEVSLSDLDILVSSVLWVAYDNDFFTGVWDNPVGPNPNVGSTDFVISDPTLQSSTSVKSQVVQSTVNGTPLVSNESGGTSSIRYFTQYIDDSLKALTNYVKRHQLVGSLSLMRTLAAYGVMLTADKLKRSYYLGDDSFPLEIGDVMSTADTAVSGRGSSLGSYAGKGVAYSQNCDFEFQTDEFGYLFVFNSIVPDVDYCQGFDRNVFHTSVLSFHTGEFDGLGPKVVKSSEVAVRVDEGADVDLKGVFGFAPTYYEYKIPYSRFVGDFVVPSINRDLNGWSTMRLFNLRPSDPAVAHNLAFVLGLDNEQYDRIFLGINEDDIVDPFRVVHRSKLELYSPMKPLYENYDFEELGHKKIEFENNGVRVN